MGRITFQQGNNPEKNTAYPYVSMAQLKPRSKSVIIIENSYSKTRAISAKPELFTKAEWGEYLGFWVSKDGRDIPKKICSYYW